MSSVANAIHSRQDPHKTSDAAAPGRSVSYEKRVSQLFAEADQTAPDPVTIDRIAKAALDARWLYYVAATYAPSDVDLEMFFEAFVVQCISGSSAHQPFKITEPSVPERKRAIPGGPDSVYGGERGVTLNIQRRHVQRT